MKRWNIETFYGSYGYIQENDDKTAYLEIIWNGYTPTTPFRQTYNSLRSAKIALGRLTDSSYTLKEVDQEASNV